MELLNEKEKRVLESIFRMGQCKINDISKDTLINRTAIYHTISLLTKKGLVTRFEKDKISYYEAIPLEQYEKWAKLKIEELRTDIDSDLKNFSLVNKKSKISLLADVKYFEGMEGIRNLYNDTIYRNEGKKIYSITDYEKGYSTLSDWLRNEYLPERVRRGIAVESIVSNTSYNQEVLKTAKEYLRELSFVDAFKDLGIEINIYDSKIAIIAFDEQSPVGVIIKNDIIVNAFREILKYIWSTGEKKNP